MWLKLVNTFLLALNVRDALLSEKSLWPSQAHAEYNFQDRHPTQQYQMDLWKLETEKQHNFALSL